MSAIFYFGYLVAQYPSSVLMQKLPIGRYFGVMILFWGLCSTLTAVTTNFATLATTRFFLGFFETAVSPVLTILVGQYWTRREQPLRACFWWIGAPIGGFVIDGLAYSITGDGWGGGKYTQWQVIYLIWGPITVGWGVLLFFCLPASPMTAWFLSERERKIAVMRVIANRTGIENRHYRTYQALECLKDPQPWAFFALALLQCIVGSGLTNVSGFRYGPRTNRHSLMLTAQFDKIVLRGLGYDDHEATRASFGGDGVQFASLLIAGVVTNYFRNARLVSSLVSNFIVLVGSLLVYCLPSSNVHGRQGGLYIMFVNTVTYIMVMSLISSNVSLCPAAKPYITATNNADWWFHEKGNLFRHGLYRLRGRPDHRAAVFPVQGEPQLPDRLPRLLCVDGAHDCHPGVPHDLPDARERPPRQDLGCSCRGGPG